MPVVSTESICATGKHKKTLERMILITQISDVCHGTEVAQWEEN